jgi:uncharacterized protein (DUF952 family)
MPREPALARPADRPSSLTRNLLRRHRAMDRFPVKSGNLHVLFAFLLLFRSYRNDKVAVIAMSLIYKIVPKSLWLQAEKDGVFKGSPVDLADGFIHFSTASQARETAAKHFAAQTDLLLAAVDPDRLGTDLRYEPSRGGDLFPHLYAAWSLATVSWVVPLPIGADGRHVFPDTLS